MNQKQYRILIVEDDKAIRTLIETALEDARIAAISAYNGASAISQARTQNPDVILLDEPTASLDPENAARLEEILDELTRAGIALAVSTHDVDFAARFAERGLVFAGGRLVADGPMKSIFSRKELLREAGLRKPWLWQAAEALRPGEESYPMTMEQFERWRKAIT